MAVPANAKTFLPQLLKFLLRTCGYIDKYRATILHYLGEDNEDLLDAALVACSALSLAIEVVLPPQT